MIPSLRYVDGFEDFPREEVRRVWEAQLSEYEDDVSGYSLDELVDLGYEHGLVDDDELEEIEASLNSPVPGHRELLVPFTDDLWELRVNDPEKYLDGHAEGLWREIVGEESLDRQELVEEGVEQEVITPEQRDYIRKEGYSEESMIDVLVNRDYQSTLDSLRSMEFLQDEIPELDEQVTELGRTLDTADEQIGEELEGGIEFVLAYGSSVNGYNIAPDSALSQAQDIGNQYYEMSDIDLLVGLEPTPDGLDKKSYLQKAAKIIYQEGGDPTDEIFKLHPSLETAEWLRNTFMEAGSDWVASGGKPKESISLKAEDDEQTISLRYHDWLKTLIRSSGFVPGYWDEEFSDHISTGTRLITDGDGSLRDGVDFDFKPESRYFGSTPCRAERLDRNYIYGIWEAAKRRHDVDVPSSLLSSNQGEKDQLGTHPRRYLVEHLIDEEFSDTELAELFEGDLTDSVPQWYEEAPGEEIEEFEERMHEKLQQETESIRDFMPPEYFKDRELATNRVPEAEALEKRKSDDPETLLRLMGARHQGSADREFGEWLALTAANLVKEKIKEYYGEMEDDLEDSIHTYSLGEMLEEQHGQQSEVWDWTEPLDSEEALEPRTGDRETDTGKQSKISNWN